MHSPSDKKPSDVEQVSDRWLDWPDEGWLASEWDITHMGCAGLAFFMYIIPGIILSGACSYWYKIR